MEQERVFPTTQTVGQISITDGGMTLRDWFAGQALAGMMAYRNEASGDFHNNCSDVGGAAYRYADAMLEARK